MSLKNPKNLLIIGAVAIALLAGTVLLANYANILPARSGSQAKTCPAAGGTPCCGAKVSANESAQAAFAQQTGAGFDAKACPLGRTEPCCAGDAAKCCCPAKCCPDKCDKCCCPKPCPPDCTKPCCAGEAATGCCPMTSPTAAANTCCGV